MEIKEIKNKNQLNNFVAQADGGQFLQSWEWGEFQKQTDNQVWRLGAYQNNKLYATATVISHNLPFGRSYLYSPHGPVFSSGIADNQKEEIIKLLLSKVRDITISTRNRFEIFFKIEPRLSREDLGNFFFNLGLKQTDAVQPRDTQILNLHLSEDDLLQGMHHKTRYNIRLAQKKGVKIYIGDSSGDFEIFWALMDLTAKRDGFKTHHKNYYEKLWQNFIYTDIRDNQQLTVKLLIAKKNNHPLAVGLFSFFGDRAVYLHGASSNENRNLMAPYLLQWQAIKLAKENNYHLFDFYGVAPENRSLQKNTREKKWQGITRFKKGFGGYEVNYVGAWDWVYNKTWYGLYNILRRIK